jgi:protein O-mannosyl-transferase
MHRDPKISRPQPTGRSRVGIAAALIVAVLLAYSNSFHIPFIYDDVGSIAENPTIRNLFSPDILSPPPGVSASGRPMLNASLALNYAAGTLNVIGYHATNVAIHLLAALVLFGLIRRTLESPRLTAKFGARSRQIAFFSALVWALHPLQTESVTYVIQRAESLMGLFYLLTMYCFARAVGSQSVTSISPAMRERHEALTSERSALPFLAWATLSVIFCAAGMATKEVMVTAPIIALLYDRVFVAASIRELLRKRWPVHAALGGTWIVTAYLAIHVGDRSGTAGFSAGIVPWQYALSQTHALFEYLRLAFWPHPQVFDYGPFHFATVSQYLAPASALALLLVGLGWIVRWTPAAGFGLGAFLLILAPTSSFLPIVTEAMAEHRLYLPLAPLITVGIAALYLVGGRSVTKPLIATTIALAALTFARNSVYQSEENLWTATIAASPTNPRAHYCLAVAVLDHHHDPRRAEAELRTAIDLEPKYLAARERLAELLSAANRLEASAAEYEAIVRDYPDDFVAHNALGLSAFERGDFATATDHFRHALRVRPKSAVAHNNLGGVLYEIGDFAEAASYERAALTLDPTYADAAYNLANALARLNQLPEARAQYSRALQLQPDHAGAHANLAGVLLQLGDRDGAITHYRTALRLRPDFTFITQRLRDLGVNP